MFITAIHEVYFGKTKDVLAIEKSIAAIRKKYKFKDKKGFTEEALKKVLDDKLYIDFTNAIKKAFGFKDVYGGFDTDDYMNCYTYPIREEKYGLMYDRFESDGKSIRFKPELKATTMIVATAPLFFTTKLTDAELTAIFLHEIGHSFKQAVIPVETCLEVLKDSLGSVIFNILSATKHTVKELEKNPYNAITNITAIIKSSPEAKERTKKRWPGFFDKILRSWKNNSNASLYVDEKFADQFAAMHGYGVELSSALVKIDYDRKDIKGAHVYNFLNSFYGLIELSLDLMLDCHPFLGARLKSTINVLEREIDKNNTIPLEEKKRLRKQIKDINLMALQYQNLDKASNYSMAKKIYFQFIYNNLKDGDIFSKFLVSAYNLDLVDEKIRNAMK